jgi:hypothetical protein
MVIEKIRRNYWITEKTGKPVVIRFRRKDGSIVKLKATKIVRKPQKIVFRRIKKVYRK